MDLNPSQIAESIVFVFIPLWILHMGGMVIGKGVNVNMILLVGILSALPVYPELSSTPGFHYFHVIAVLGLQNKSPFLFDLSEVIMVWDDGTTNGAKVLEQNLKLKFNYQGFEEGERLSGAEKVGSDTTMSYSKRQIDLITGDFNGDGLN